MTCCVKSRPRNAHTASAGPLRTLAVAYLCGLPGVIRYATIMFSRTYCHHNASTLNTILEMFELIRAIHLDSGPESNSILQLPASTEGRTSCAGRSVDVRSIVYKYACSLHHVLQPYHVQHI
jgi:hypothetical protein